MGFHETSERVPRSLVSLDDEVVVGLRVIILKLTAHLSFFLVKLRARNDSYPYKKVY